MNPELMGYDDLEMVDGSGGDKEAKRVKDGRAIKADTAGIVRIQFWNGKKNALETEVLSLNAGVIHEVRNLRKVFGTTGVAGSADAGCYTTGATSVLRQPAVKTLR